MLFLYPLSLLPMRVLYWVSNFICFFFSKVLRYRSEVIDTNLRNSFPEKSETERTALKKAFYLNLSDLIVEIVKGFTVSKKTIMQRNQVFNQELLDSWDEKGQPVIAVMAHQCNWEWALLRAGLTLKQDIMVVYKPLSNKYFDRLMNRTRSRFGVTMVPMKEASSYFKNNQNKSFCSALVCDQAPNNPKRAQWVEFLNQKTAVLPGAGILSKKHNMPVLFVSAVREKRGYYSYHIEPLTDIGMDAVSVNVAHTKRLEEMILDAPEGWLWSHKRWKHTG